MRAEPFYYIGKFSTPAANVALEFPVLPDFTGNLFNALPEVLDPLDDFFLFR